jgi:hypothetical protein
MGTIGSLHTRMGGARTEEVHNAFGRAWSRHTWHYVSGMSEAILNFHKSRGRALRGDSFRDLTGASTSLRNPL